MNERCPWREWPLAVFTVAIQFACGLAFAATVLDWLSRPVDDSLASYFAISVFPVVALGMLASLLHLGRPLSAWRALTNAARSRLSQEILAVGAFAFNAFVYGRMWSTETGVPRLACGASTVALGTFAVFMTARVYRLPAHTPGQYASVRASFPGTALLFGGLLPTLHAGGYSPVFALTTVAGSAAIVLSVVLMLHDDRLAASGLDDAQVMKWVLAAIQLLSATVGATTILLLRNHAAPSPGILYAAFALMVAGISIGRLAMFVPRPAPAN